MLFNSIRTGVAGADSSADESDAGRYPTSPASPDRKTPRNSVHPVDAIRPTRRRKSRSEMYARCATSSCLVGRCAARSDPAHTRFRERVAEAVKDQLLLSRIARWRTQRGLLERGVHALMPTIVLRRSRTSAFR